MNRPRESVLSLFDPLRASDDGHESDDLSDPEKENSMPSDHDLSMTAFFTRITKPPQHKAAAPRKRLIDVGDVTVDDTNLAVLEEEDEAADDDGEDENNSFNFLLKTPTRPAPAMFSAVSASPSQRTPFAELSLDGDLTPLALKTSRRNPPSSPPSPPRTVRKPIVAPNPVQESLLSSIINAVTSAGVTFAETQPTDVVKVDAVPRDDGIEEVETSVPQIEVTPSDLLPATATPPVVFAAASEESSSSFIMSSHLRPNPPSYAHDANRYSTDLLASFYMQIQAPDMSFDLLKDDISFSAENWTIPDDEEDFDRGAKIPQPNNENLKQPEIEERPEIEENVQQPSSPVATPVDKNDASPGPTVDPSPVLQTAIPEYPPQTPSTPIMPSCASDPITIVKQGHARNNSDPVVPPAPKISKVRDEGKRASQQSAPTVVPTVLAVEAAIEPLPRTMKKSGVLATPPAQRSTGIPSMLPPPVHALRIVKRAKRPDLPKVESATSTVTKTVSPPVSSTSTLPVVATAGTSMASRQSRPVKVSPTLSGAPAISRSAAGAPLRSAADRSNSTAEASKNNLQARPPIPKLGAPILTGNGPRRVLVTDPTAGGTGQSQTKPKPTAVISAQVPSRVGVGATRLPATAKPAVRPPIIGSKSAGVGATSALPRPTFTSNNTTSKLPGPVSGIGRLRSVGASSGGGTAGAPGVKGLPRRAM